VNGRRLRKGVTFTELLVSISFLGICASISVDSTAELTASVARAERYGAAFALATNTLNANTAPFHDAFVIAPIGTSTFVSPIGGGTTASVSVAISSTGFTDVSLVHVEVSYPERKRGKSVTERIRLQEYVRKR
jgi:hypothetical protein